MAPRDHHKGSDGPRGDGSAETQQILCNAGSLWERQLGRLNVRSATFHRPKPKRFAELPRLLGDGMADFEGLCDSTYERVANAAFLILGNHEEALDVAQETFSRAFERWEQVRMMENPEGWLYQVAVNLSLSSRRKTRRRFLGQAPDRAAPHAEPSDPELARALGRLSPAQRTAVVLRFYLDLSIESTAQALHKQPGTIRALTSQGIARLREDLGPNWLEDEDEQSIS